MATLGLFGTYDPDAPRLKRLLAGWRALGGEVVEVHEPLWPSGARRVELPRAGGLGLVGRWMGAEMRLWRRRRELSGVEALLVPYPGHFDMALASRVGRGFGVPVIFDPFLSLYDTAVGDRALVAAESAKGRAIGAIDRWSLRAADVVLADTPAMAAYYRRVAGVSRLAVVPVGADESLFAPTAETGDEVLFYGKMIPLHGVETIVEAAKRLPEVRFHLVGSGQVDAARLSAEAPNVRWTPEVPYEALPGLMAGAAVCLGIFGTSGKAARVVPHKVYEAAAMGKAIVTADTPAIRDAFPESLALVPAGDAEALAGAIAELLADPARRASLGAAAHARFMAAFSTRAIGEALRAAIAMSRELGRAPR